MNYAQEMHANVRGLAAWNVAGLPRFVRDAVKRTVRNQHGTRYSFVDGSWYFVPKGYATGSIGWRPLPDGPALADAIKRQRGAR